MLRCGQALFLFVWLETAGLLFQAADGGLEGVPNGGHAQLPQAVNGAGDAQGKPLSL